MQFVVFFVLLLLLIFKSFIPEEPNVFLLTSCIIVFLLFSYRIFIAEKKYNLKLTFSSVFLLFLFICGFFIVILEILGFLDLLHIFIKFDVKYMNYWACLMNFAVVSYWFGIRIASIKYARVYSKSPNLRISTSVKTYFKIFSHIITIIYLFYFFTSNIDKHDISGVYVQLLLSSIPIGLLLNSIYYKDKIKNSLSRFLLVNRFPLIEMFIVVILQLSIGDRYIPVNYILSILFIIQCYCLKFTYRKIILIGVFAFLFLFIIGLSRSSYSGNTARGSFTSSIENSLSSKIDALVIFQDFIPANTCMYLSSEIKEVNNVDSYSSKFFIDIISPIPFLPTFLSELFFNKKYFELSSGKIFTQYNFASTGTRDRSGVGSQIVADVYLFYGIFGVFLFFLILGFFQHKFLMSMHSTSYSIIIYYVIFADSVYFARSTMFNSYRTIVWCILFYMIFYTISKNKRLYA